MSATSKLRIVLYDPSGHGGICHYTYQLAESLARLGADITVMTTEGYELKHLERHFKLKVLFKKSRLKNLAANIVARVPATILYKTKRLGTGHQTDSSADESIQIPTVLKMLRLRVLLLKAAVSLLFDRPHVIHVQWLMDRDEDYKFISLLKLLGFTIIYTAHDLIPTSNSSDDARNTLEKIYHRVDAIIVHGKGSKDEIVSAFHLSPAKIHVIPHGSNDLFYPDKGISKEAAKTKLGICPTQKVILFFGIIKRYKGLEYLIEAFQEVKEQVENAMLLVVGRIYDTDVKAFEYYSRLIEGIRSHDNVMCVPEYVPFEKIGDYFSAADVVVLPYTKTYTSGVLLSAYAAGRPVIVTDTGALAEVVEPGKSGIVVPPKDSKALAQAMVEIFNGSDVQQMGRYAKHLAEGRYSWTTVASTTNDLYRSLTV
jgi:glycosyltransferase involved in cell wall biosynthesis